jgi:hypothetical protein
LFIGWVIDIAFMIAGCQDARISFSLAFARCFMLMDVFGINTRTLPVSSRGYRNPDLTFGKLSWKVIAVVTKIIRKPF